MTHTPSFLVFNTTNHRKSVMLHYTISHMLLFIVTKCIEFSIVYSLLNAVVNNTFLACLILSLVHKNPGG